MLESGVIIGTIVKSNSHISYLCRVYGKLEIDHVPEPRDYAFGTFVALVPEGHSDVQLIGVVRDTLLLNPDFGNLGPRLSTDGDLAVLSPDYLDEKGVLVDVLVVGSVEGGEILHGIPALAPQIGTRAESMPDEDIYAFHRDGRGRFLIGYLPHLIMRNDPMIANLLLVILERLEGAFPGQQRLIGVLKNNISWKARVVPAG